MVEKYNIPVLSPHETKGQESDASLLDKATSQNFVLF
jgi:protein involved in ribonucleotide reduction